MASERFRFPGASGQMLDGRIDRPDGPPIGTALFAHCFTCTKDSKAAAHVARSLADAGWRVLRFDFTGLGGSEGEFANAGFVTNIDDITSAAAALDKAGDPVGLLIGHSLGGAAVIAAAERIASVRAVATIGAPFHVDHVLERLGEGVRDAEREGVADIDIGGRPFKISRDFIAQVFDQPQAQRLAHLRRALMVMHAPTDTVVGLDNAKQIFEAARHPKSFVALDGADHLLTNAGSAQYAARIIAAWAARYAEEKA